MRCASFISCGFITATVENPPERKLAKRTFVQWDKRLFEVVLFQFVIISTYLKLANLLKNPKGHGKVGKKLILRIAFVS